MNFLLRQKVTMSKTLLSCLSVLCFGCYPQSYHESYPTAKASAIRYEQIHPERPAQRFRLTEAIVLGLSNRQIYDLNVIIEWPVTFGAIRVPAGSRAKIYGSHRAYSILGGLEKILYVTFPEYNVSDILTLRFDAKGGVYTLTDVYWGLPSARSLEFIWSARSRGNYLLVEGY